MDILEAMRSRKSIRDFHDKPVSREVIRELLEFTCRAPSAMNTQPWEFTVVAGEALDSVSRALVENVQAGQQPHPEHAVVGWPLLPSAIPTGISRPTGSNPPGSR